MTAVETRPSRGDVAAGGTPPAAADDAPGGHTAPAAERRRELADVVRAYVALTKPRIIELLLVSTIPVMFLAQHGVPRLWPVVAIVLGGYLSAGSANALNCYIDRDIDEAMRRTRRRPLPAHTVSARETMVFGIVLGVVSTLWIGLAVNWLSSMLALAANLFYVFVYSLILKRRTWQNIIWGGIAGCMPALIGWTAVTDRLAWPPVVLFGVVFLWTPPHTWALGMRYREDYAAAKVPMLPVVATEARVVRQILLYTWATVLCSLLLWPIAHTGLVYPSVAAVLGAGFLVEAYRLRSRANSGLTGALLKPMKLFHFSNAYLALLFVAAAVDAAIFH